ncbi:MAG: hypothetical protein ACFFD1_02525, partial [Candidatus Thorarchaeota archaeon]
QMIFRESPLIPLKNTSDPTITPKLRLTHSGTSPLAITSFDNASIFNVTRSISVNDWGAVNLNDTISINVSTDFDSFSVYFLTDIINHVHLQRSMVLGNTTNADVSVEDDGPLPNSDVTQMHVVFNTTIQSVNLSLIYIITDALTVNSGTFTLGAPSDPNLPYRFSLDAIFYPWYSFAITSFDFYGGTRTEVGSENVSLSTSIPKSSDVGGSFDYITSAETQFSYLHYSLNELSSFNYSMLSNYGYNLANLGTRKFIPAFNESFLPQMTQKVTFDVYFQGAFLEYTRIDSTIDINPWNTVSHTEVITISNKGVPGALPGGPKETATASGPAPIVLYVPVDSGELQGVYARDSLGNLTNSNTIFRSDEPGYAKNVTAIRVVPRIEFSPGTNLTITVGYQIKNSVALEEKGGILTPSWNLMTPLVSEYNWTVREMNVKIIFPTLASAGPLDANALSIWNPDSVSYPASQSLFSFNLIGFSRPSIEMHFKDIGPSKNVVLPINFSLPPFIGWFIEPFLFVVFFFIIGILLVFFRTLSFRLSPVVNVEREKEDVPFDLIEGYVKFYQEKTALRSRMTKLEEKKKQMKKVDYDKQRQTLESKAANVDRDLLKYTQALSKRGGRFREAVRSIEISETSRDDILRNLTDLDKKKRQQRISPDIYMKLRDDYTKKLRRANTTIERVLVDLRSLLTEKR